MLSAVCVLASRGLAAAEDGFESSETAPVVRGEESSNGQGMVPFTYAPPSGIQFEEQVNRVIGSDYGARGTRIDVFSATNVQKITRTESGYRVRMDINEIKALHNGKPVVNPIMDAMKETGLTYLVGANGRADKIEGINQIADILRAKIPKKKLTPELETQLAGSDMERKELADWNARYGAWNRQSFLPGKTYYGIGTYTLEPGLFIRYAILAKVVGSASCHEGDRQKSCVQIRFDYATEQDLIDKARRSSIREAAEFLKKGDVVGGRLDGHMDRIVDPKTLLIYSEVQKKTILFPLSINDNEEIRVRRIERMEYSYRYDHMAPRVPRIAGAPD